MPSGGDPAPPLLHDWHVAASPVNVGFLIRISSFALVLAATAGWDFLAPRRVWAVRRRPRLPSNLGILIVDVLAPGT